jgi:thiamine pyrophosphate-dependent acetolactate synthase large subunit-like protein
VLAAVALWHVEEPGELLISSGLAALGFGLPAAAAAALVFPDPHVIFTGDGGIGMALAELETLGRLRLSLAVVVFNDATGSLIAIKQRRNAAAATERSPTPPPTLPPSAPGAASRRPVLPTLSNTTRRLVRR